MKNSLKKLMLGVVAVALVVPVAIVLTACGKQDTTPAEVGSYTFSISKAATYEIYDFDADDNVDAIGKKVTIPGYSLSQTITVDGESITIADYIANDATISNLTSTKTTVYSPAAVADKFKVSELADYAITSISVDPVELGLIVETTPTNVFVLYSARTYSSVLTNKFTDKTFAEISAMNPAVKVSDLFPAVDGKIDAQYTEQLVELGLVNENVTTTYKVGDTTVTNFSNYSAEVVVSAANVEKLSKIGAIHQKTEAESFSVTYELKADGVLAVTYVKDGKSVTLNGQYLISVDAGIKTVRGYVANEEGNLLSITGTFYGSDIYTYVSGQGYVVAKKA